MFTRNEPMIETHVWQLLWWVTLVHDLTQSAVSRMLPPLPHCSLLCQLHFWTIVTSTKKGISFYVTWTCAGDWKGTKVVDHLLLWEVSTNMWRRGAVSQTGGGLWEFVDHSIKKGINFWIHEQALGTIKERRLVTTSTSERFPQVYEEEVLYYTQVAKSEGNVLGCVLTQWLRFHQIPVRTMFKFSPFSTTPPHLS